jgi:LuxR family maltose regulon positive regulatory protein
MWNGHSSSQNQTLYSPHPAEAGVAPALDRAAERGPAPQADPHLREWAHSRGGATPPIAAAWLSLDESDNDPTRFLAYLIAALQTIEASIGKGALSALESPQPPPTEGILTALINEVAAVPDRIILILDDYHLIEAQPIHDALTFLLRRLPPQMHLVIASREDPHLPLARLRARGQLTELRATDLRFTSSEAAEFLNQVMGLDLSAEDIAALERRTEGWITGLQLVAISIQGSRDASGFIKSFTGSHRYVLDYLIEEVLDQQPEDIQTFLLQTAILDRLTGSLCDALTGQEDGQATLEMLERANLFIIPLDNERRWYRYHHLFADLLRQRLHQTQPEQLPILHIRAGEWFKRQGLNREAIKHSLAARDYQGAAELIRTIAIDIMQQGEHTTVVGWINALPEELVKEQPYLCVLHAWWIA